MITFRRTLLQGCLALLLTLSMVAPLSGLLSAPAGQALWSGRWLSGPVDRPVAVLVGKAQPAQTAEEVVARLGGQVTRDLPILNAFAAQLPGRAVRSLADSPAVGWISLDAPVHSATTLTQSVRDEFNKKSYGNNDGTHNWAGDWLEIDDNGKPKNGKIKIHSGNLVFSRGAAALQRGVDLSLATWAQLTFQFQRRGLDGPEDFVILEVSADGGLTWIEMDRFAGPADDPQALDAQYDLSGYRSAETVLRFSSSEDLDKKDQLQFDDLQITFPWDEPGEPPAETGGNLFPTTLGLLQAQELGWTGAGISVAVIDSGLTLDADFSLDPGQPEGTRILARQFFNAEATGPQDDYGHGTHVAGLIAGNGSDSQGLYQGIAPGAHLISLKVNGVSGVAHESDVVAALQWVYDHKDQYNIRVVNLSLNSTVEDSYHNSPMDAAAEILWFNGVVVVVSAGNKGPAGGFNTANAAPANDPFLITVGAADEHGTSERADDSQAPFSAHGVTLDGHEKPDLLAPGKDLFSVLSSDSAWGLEHPDRLVWDGQYIRLSGTSMSAPLVAGTVALLLEAEPGLNPDQVKYRLLNASPALPNGDRPYLDILAVLTTPTSESANTGQPASQLLWTGDEPVAWDSVNWNSVNWNAVNWNAVNWNAVNWNAVNWNSLSWEE